MTAADNATTRTYTIAVTRSDTVASSCTGQQRIPNETAGPYPGDGTNGPNVLVMSGVVRNDIRSSFGGMSGTAPGVPLTVILRLVSASTCQPLAGYAVYLWHCTRDGGYSLYTSGFTSQNYLRGIQDADASGQVTFQTIYPGCYSGRWPHIHFEVFPSISASNSAGNKVATSQIALPRSQNDEVYATAGYEASVEKPGERHAGVGQRLQRRLFTRARDRDRQRRDRLYSDADRGDLVTSYHLIQVSPERQKRTSGASTPGAGAPLMRTSPLPAGMRR